ncbi:MAG: hypothetical protein M1546_22090 [Chloroflexi bacterium]|nr:hypothetical protein [Chloroflexota bacterium]
MSTYTKANMNAPVDWEQLMIDALDGTLAECDRQALETYFDLHPQERALFERMRGLDDTLHLAPLVAAPASLAPQVMRQTAQTHVAQPPLCASQIAFLIFISSVLVVCAGVAMLALGSLLSPEFPVREIQTLLAFMRGVAEFGVSLLDVVTTFLRAVFSQPTAWVVLVGMIAVVTLWMRLLAVVFVPALALQFAST